jgi:hypothetical protein
MPWDHWHGRQRPNSDLAKLQRETGNETYTYARSQINSIRNHRRMVRNAKPGNGPLYPLNIIGSIEMFQDHSGASNRGRFASDPRDMIFSTLSMSNYPHLIPDYSQSVRDTFTHIAKYVEQKSCFFGMGHIEDHSFRVRHDLPSWMADYTSVLRPGPFQSKGGFYNASGALPKVLYDDTNADILAVKGLHIDTVAQVEGTWADLMAGDAMAGYVDLLNKQPVVYKNGEKRTEAFWRTLIAGRPGNGPRPPDSSWRPFVREALFMLVIFSVTKSMCAAAFASPTDVGTGHPLSLKDNPRLHTMLDQMGAISAADDTDVFPHPDAVNDFYSQHRQKVEDAIALLDEPGSLLSMFPGAWKYYDALPNFLPYRRLFRTKSGYIGIAGQSLQVGDDVVLAQGSGEPWIVRCRTDSERYRFVATAYLHGIMNAELVENLKEKAVRMELD